MIVNGNIIFVCYRFRPSLQAFQLTVTMKKEYPVFTYIYRVTNPVLIHLFDPHDISGS